MSKFTTLLVKPIAPALRLRQARMMDVYAINYVMRRATRHLSTDFYTPEQIDAMIDDDLCADTQLIRDGTYYVVEVNGQIVACGGWSRYASMINHHEMHDSNDNNIIDPQTGAAKIRLMFVDPDFSRRGIAAMLLQNATFEAELHGYHSLELIGTLTGQGLYERYGFQALEPIIFTGQNGVDVPLVKMLKKL